MQNMLSLIRSCVDDYEMISENDRIAVGVSGGKDSLTLLYLLAEMRRFYPKHYDLCAVTLDLGYADMDFSPVEALCRTLDVPFYMRRTDIRHVVFDIKRDPNPCSLCAKMRRGALHEEALSHGFTKVALGHHFDDAIETFMLSLIYEGRISSFRPVTYLDRTGITVIRPMLYLHEKTVANFAKKTELPIVENSCPADKNTKREEIKALLYELEGRYSDIKKHIFGGLQRSPLPGWKDIKK